MPSTILVIDDDFAIRRAFDAILGASGYHLESASNGPEGLAKAAELIPDLILLDVMMPHMDGFDVCRHLRATPRLAEVPIIMVTALDDRDSRMRGLEAGADDFIPKPIDAFELRARVQAVTRLNRYRRLLDERARFEWVVEHADDGYLVIGHDDSVRYANAQARRCLGVPVDGQPIEEPFLTLAARQYRCEPQEVWRGWPQPADDQAQPRYLVRPESLTAREMWLQVDPFGPAQEPGEGQLVRLRDVTEQMSLQRDVWKFHSVIVHKLRTPLVGIIGGLQTLFGRADSLSQAEVERMARIALEAAQRLHSDIEDVLQYLSTPQLAFPGAGAPVAQVRAIVAEYGTTLDLNPVSVSIVDEWERSRLKITRRALELVLAELLENARKFHPQQTPTITVTIDGAPDGMARLRVIDDGVTLSPEQIAQAWKPYYQGEKYQTGQVKGMGLGLPMIASLIYSVGGTVRLYNRDDRPGIIVELLVPRAA